MHKIQRVATLLGLLVTLFAATALRAQTDFSIKIYATDGSSWKDSVYIGKYTSATDVLTDSLSPALVEKELPPLPPSGPSQAPDLRVIDWNGSDLIPYGQGVRVDLRNLVSNGQRNVYRLSFRRGDPDGSGITLSWQSDLDTVSGGGFYLTDGFNGLLFDPINMAEQTSVSNLDGSWLTTSGGIVDIMVGDGTMMRTFTNEQIATAADLKGKVGKFEKPKPISVDFSFTLQTTDTTVTGLFLAFDKIVEGTVSFSDGHLPLAMTAAKAYSFAAFNPATRLDSGCTITVTGNGNKGKAMKTKYGLAPASTKAGTALAAYTYQILRLPSPNINNIGDEIYLSPLNLTIGMNAGVGLASSIGNNEKNKPIVHHISLPKWKDVTKTLYKFKNVVILQDSTAHCLDTIKSKANIKMLKSIGPDKTVYHKDDPVMGNKLIGNMIALKFNMAASALGHTAAGFGDLVYTNPGHKFDGKTVDVIADSGDWALACAGGYAGGWTVQDYADFLDTINAEFSGDFDTVSWGGTQTVATGIKPVVLSSIFTSTGPSMAPVSPPADYSSLYEVPSVFSLSQNYPNPFNPTTTIEFSIPEDAFVTIRVYNMLGQVVATLADREEFSSGENWVELDGASLSTGVYYYRIVVNDGQFQDVRKMVLMK